MEHKFHFLEVPNKTKVGEFVDCAMASSACLPLNMASACDYEGLFWCSCLEGRLSVSQIVVGVVGFSENRISGLFSHYEATYFSYSKQVRLLFASCEKLR